VSDRIAHAGLAALRMDADQAAAQIAPGMTVGMCGFTGAG
jgi:succinyl-CoA:acetate CoA-transferase